MDTTSPRFTEYGKLIETKNGWNVSNFVGRSTNPRPLTGSIENPVITHDVIVSGAFLCNVVFPSNLNVNNFVFINKKSYKL